MRLIEEHAARLGSVFGLRLSDRLSGALLIMGGKPSSDGLLLRRPWAGWLGQTR